MSADDLDLALRLADQADELTMARFGALDLRIETKPDLTPVTDADQGAEEALRAALSQARPDDSVFGEYTVEQVKEMFYHAEKPEQGAPPARKPLTDEDISAIVQSMSAYTWDAHMLARAIERAHGIGGEE